MLVVEEGGGEERRRCGRISREGGYHILITLPLT